MSEGSEAVGRQAEARGHGRKQAVDAMKRGLILDAAKRVFAAEGLEGASLRAIAAEAGYTPAALYFHFDSKEAIYAALLAESLDRLQDMVDGAVAKARTPKTRIRAAAWAFYDFYAEKPQDLDLGFYLFRGGMKPKGVGRDRDTALNEALARSLQPIADAALTLGRSETEARAMAADVFAHIVGLLLLHLTGRLRLFAAAPEALLEQHLGRLLAAP